MAMMLNDMEYISSPNPIKTVHTKSLKQYKTLFKFQYIIIVQILQHKKMLHLLLLALESCSCVLLIYNSKTFLHVVPYIY